MRRARNELDSIADGRDFPRALLDLLRQSSRVAALTGAGVSQESRLRTFRDAHPSTGSPVPAALAASLAYAARNRGAALVEINLEPTPPTPKVDFFLQGKSGEILPALMLASR